MFRRPTNVRPPDAVADGVDAVIAELALPVAFPPDALDEAQQAGTAWRPQRPALDVPFVTIDPPGSRDLDQALHLERRGEGHRVRYAIADVGAFVRPGGAIDREAHARATTVYLPDRRIPMHPPVLCEGAASLLPGVDRPAFVWTIDLDSDGATTAVRLERATVRSRAQLDYAGVDGDLRVLLQEVGERRAEQERARGGVSLRVPEQEVTQAEGRWSIAYRVPLATEDHNAQISLLTGMAAAGIMLDGGVGLLRTQPEPEERSFARLRRAAGALGVAWPRELAYAAWIRTLDPRVTAHAAVLHEAAGLGHGAGYTAFGPGVPPQGSTHFAIAASYAHATAPLRRLADRYVLETCLALTEGNEVPEHVRAALPALPQEMAAGTQRAGRAAREAVDLVEAIVLADRVGDTFEAVAVDDDLIQLRDPAVLARIEGGHLPAGEEIRVRLDVADPATRDVVFTLA
jgi:exoribonuclease R